MLTETQKNIVDHIEEADKILYSIIHDSHYTTVENPALLKNGIRKLNGTQKRRFRTTFKKNAGNYTYTDFIPASGSGSRLLGTLMAFSKNFDPDEETLSHYINRTQSYNLNIFFHHLKDLPFYNLLQEDILCIMDNTVSMDMRRLQTVRFILDNDKLPISDLPKALIPIHKRNDNTYTAFDEQIYLHSTLRGFRHKQIHFTIAPTQQISFEKKLVDVSTIFSELDVSVSTQNTNTDVYCLDSSNNLVKDLNGDFLKRPSGHGALLENLNNIETDIIHISNIDNVPNHYNQKVYLKNRKELIGYLIYVTSQVHKYLIKLEDGALKNTDKRGLRKFLKKYFHLDLNTVLTESNEGPLSTIYHLLNVPIRIAAMVPVTDHPGGGPYWCKNSKGINMLQIVEGVEIDMRDDDQVLKSKEATHFNPVSIFLFTRDYEGNKFDLTNHASKEPSMIIDKTYNGEEIRFIERPGLWNGGMKDHLTMFIQADHKIFNPIKELTDVFSENHMSND